MAPAPNDATVPAVKRSSNGIDRRRFFLAREMGRLFGVLGMVTGREAWNCSDIVLFSGSDAIESCSLPIWRGAGRYGVLLKIVSSLGHPSPRQRNRSEGIVHSNLLYTELV